jgi:hypothetical protein
MDKKNSISLEDLAFKFVPIQALLMWGLIRLVYWVSNTPMTDGHSSGAMINAVLMLSVGWVMIFPMYVTKNFKIEIEIDHKKKANGDG